MEWLGLVCLALVLCYSSYPARVRKLENKLRKLMNKGEKKQMSKLISELTGKKCKIVTEESMVQITGEVAEVDEEWIKFIVTGKKSKVKIIRIDSIRDIELEE